MSINGTRTIAAFSSFLVAAMPGTVAAGTAAPDQQPEARKAEPPPLPEGAIDANGWAHFEFDYQLQNPMVFELTGELVDGRCHFYGDSDTYSDRPIEERSLAINPAQCTMIMERGEIPSDRMATVQADVATESDAQESVDPEAVLAESIAAGDDNTGWFNSGNSTGGTAQNYKNGNVRKYAYHKVYFEDPPQADVNSVETQVDWTSNGSCANLGTTRYRTNWGWITGTGWSRQTHSRNGSRACGYASEVSTAKYFNGIFCTGRNIWAHYDGVVSITGRPDGRYAMSWDTWLETNSALCGGLLSFHRSHGYFSTWPQNH